MMREFGKPDTPVIIDTIEPKPQEGIVRLDETTPAEDLSAPAEGLRPFHVEMEEDTQSNNTAKIIGGVVVGLLIIGGGIYAYESSRSVPAPQQVALKTPAVNHPALDQTGAAPPAPEAATPDNNAAPAPAATAPAKSKPARHEVKAASNPDENSVASAAPAPAMARSADSAINAPMTLTPENAPPPEQSAQSAPTGQTAMQQPVIAPDVNNQTNAPTPSVATNTPAATTPATNTPTGMTPSGLPTAPLAQQQLTQMENQPAPQPQPAPAPAQ